MHRLPLSRDHEPGGARQECARCEGGGVRDQGGRLGGHSISAMDLKRVLDQTVRELRREVSKKVLKVPEIEIKVCEATSNEPWGPHGTIMGDIAQATRNFQEYHVIMGVLWKRLHDSGKNWRHVYKSLAVMEYLIANGAERVIEELREQAYQIQALLEFQYMEPNGKDQGINVQKKAKSLLALLNDRGKIRELRQTAAGNRDKYRGLSSSGVSFNPSSYVSGIGSYSDTADERHGGGSSVNAQKDDDGMELESRRSQRESNRDNCSCGELEHKEACAAPKGGDERSDNIFSSKDGDRNRDLDEYRQYSGRSANRGVVAAVTRAQSTLSQASSSGHTSQGPPRKSAGELVFSIKSASDDLDDFDPRGTSKRSVPVAKEESSTQSQNALEDLFADVEFQSSFPSISATSNNLLERDNLQTPLAFMPISKPNSMRITAKDEFQPCSRQANDAVPSDGALFDSFNPSFTSFNESPKSAPQDVTSRGFHPLGEYVNFISNEQFHVGPSTPGSPSTTSADNLDIFGSFNPFSTKDHVMAGNHQQQKPPPHSNPLLTTTSSTFWNDPLITSLVDLAIGGGQRQDQNTQLSMNEVGINMAASGSVVPRTNRLSLGAKSLAFGRQINGTTGPGRSASDPPKST